MADNNEVNQFLNDLGFEPSESPLERPLEVPTEEKPEEPRAKVEKDDDDFFKNRRYRRLEKRYQEEHDSNVRQAEIIRQLSETQKFKDELGADDLLKKLDVIYGNDEQGKLVATNTLKEVISGLVERGISQYKSQVDEERTAETRAEREADEEVDGMLEHVEDEWGLDMDDEDIRRGYITLMEKMSSKYDDGNIKEFADPDAVAEAYVALQKRSAEPSRAKELASRSMTRSGQSQPSKLQDNAIERFMQENGFDWTR